jgi:integrase/recombinase XerD
MLLIMAIVLDSCLPGHCRQSNRRLQSKPHRLARATYKQILSPEEVLQFLGCVTNIKQRTILTTCYAAGLRISEAVHLMPSAIDRQRMVIRIEQGKGRKDRYVMLSPKLLQVLSDYWHAARPRGCLFPGDRPGQPITRGAVELACQAVARHE